MRFYGWELLAVCRHPDSFGNQRHWSGDIMFIISYVTSRDHVLKGSLCKFMGGSPSRQVNTVIFGDIWSTASEDTKYLIYHVTSQNHMTKESCNFMSWSSLFYVTTLSSLVAIAIAVVEL